MKGHAIRKLISLTALGCLAWMLPLTSLSGSPTPKMACGHAHAPDKSERTVSGRQVHRKTNPQGRVFVFGTFSAAEKARAVTEPSDADTWFEGYAWAVLVCDSTQRHIGWRFTGAGETFYALLIPEPSPGA